MYHVPHRSWIRLGSLSYSSNPTDEMLQWAAANIDWIDNPDWQVPSKADSYLTRYKALTDAPILAYINVYCAFAVRPEHYEWQPGGGWYDMVQWCLAHGVDLESMLLHFDVPTTVTLEGKTYTLPAGSRVPTYWWMTSEGDLSLETNSNPAYAKARIVTNPASPHFRAFIVEWAQNFLAQHPYDGFFVDNSAAHYVLQYSGGTISAGGTYAEYPGLSRADAHIAWANDMALIFAEARAAFGPKGQSKILCPNVGTVNWPAAFPHCEMAFREFQIQATRETVSSIDQFIPAIKAAHDAGVKNVISTFRTGSTAYDLPREKLESLALYYQVANPDDYFCRQDSNGGDPQNWFWFGALDCDVGQPEGESFTFAAGIDPTSPKQDSGVGVVSGNTLTDASKSWPVDQWQSLYVVDSAGTICRAWHSTPNTITFYSGPVPVSGPYTVGTNAYKVYGRQYSNALVLAKPKPFYGSTTGDDTATVHNMPGRFKPLNADGTLGDSITQVSLRNAEGAILIKETNPVATEIPSGQRARFANITATGCDENPMALPSDLTMEVVPATAAAVVTVGDGSFIVTPTGPGDFVVRVRSGTVVSPDYPLTALGAPVTLAALAIGDPTLEPIV